MTITPINPLPSLFPAQTAEIGHTASQTRFIDWLEQKVNETNTAIVSAESQVRNLAAGGADNLHQVMLDLEKARLSLNLIVQVRNRTLEAYQEVLRMQI